MIKRIAPFLFLGIFLFSYHTADAISFKGIFNKIFGKTEQTIKDVPLGANAYEATREETPTLQIAPTADTEVEVKTITPTKETSTISTPVKTPTVSTFKVLRVGMTGDKDVAVMQTKLIALGYLKEGNATGNFATLTEAAVKAFQKASSLSVTGVVDEKTSGALSKAASAQTFTTGGIKPIKPTLTLPTLTAATPSLSIKVSKGTPAAQNIAAGTKSVAFVKYDFTANNTAATVTEIYVASNPTGTFSNLENLRILTDVDQYGAKVITPPGNANVNDPVARFYGSLSIPAGQTKTITVVADVKATATPGTVLALSVAGHQVSPLIQSTYGTQPTGNPFTITAAPTPVATGSIVVGGRNQNGPFNDVFKSSTPGVWTLASANSTTSSKWSGRGDMATAYFKNKYWVIAGDNSTQDVWNSADGITWTQAPAPNFSGHGEIQAVVANNKLYIIAGKKLSSSNNQASVFSTADGVTWTTETTNAEFGARIGYMFAAHDGKLFVIGGHNGTTGGVGSLSSEVWMSSTLPAGCTSIVGYSNTTGQPCSTVVPLGKNWTKIRDGAGWGPLARAKALSFNGKLYVIGGEKMTGSSVARSAKVWTSLDGVAWTLLNTSIPSVVTTMNHIDVAAIGNKLWMSDFQLSNGAQNKVWSSSDAITWNLESSNAAWSPRYGYKIIAGEANQTSTACTVNSFVASPTTIQSGQAATLSWTTSGCTSVTINGVPRTLSGSMSTGSLTSNMAYGILGVGTNSSSTANAYVTVQ